MMAPHFKLALEILLAVVAGLAAWKFLLPLARGIRNLKHGQADWDRVIDAELDPLFDRLDRGEEVSRDEVQKLAVQWPLRYRLYWGLSSINRLDLFPDEFLHPGMQSIAQMAYWLMHPNEMGCPPAQIQAIDIYDAEVKGRTGSFIVLRFRAPDGSWGESRNRILRRMGGPPGALQTRAFRLFYLTLTDSAFKIA